MTLDINRITIKRIRKPKDENVNDELQWFCDSLGLFGNRDKDKSRFRTFVILLKSLNTHDGLTSDQISEKVGLTRGTVVHHLNSLMGAGLIVYQRKRYVIRVENLTSLVDEVERDLLRTMNLLRSIAGDIDKRLEL